MGLLVGGEDVNDSVDRFDGVVGVEGSEDEHSGLGGGEGEGDGFEVAHFSDEDDFGVLAQRGSEAVGKGGGVGGDFPLGDDAFFVAVDEFDGLLDGDDVLVVVAIDVVDEGGKGGRFSGASGAGDEDEAGAHVAEFFNNLGDVEVLDGGDFGGDEAEDGAVAVLLFEEVTAEAGVVVHFIGEVEVAFFFKEGKGVGFANSAEVVADCFVVEDGLAFDGDDFSVGADFWRGAFGEVEVGAVLVDEDLKEAVD